MASIRSAILGTRGVARVWLGVLLAWSLRVAKSSACGGDPRQRGRTALLCAFSGIFLMRLAAATAADNLEPATWEQWLSFAKEGAEHWQIEDPSGANDFTAQIDKAITTALGPVTTVFRGQTFEGITLGSKFSDHAPDKEAVSVEHATPYLLEISIKAEADADDSEPLKETWALVDAETDQIVGVRISYLSGPEVTLERVLASFGKTAHKIDEHSVNHGTYVEKWTTLRYTFPSTVVRVRFLQLAGKFRNGATHIWILDRKHAEKSMRAYANALITCCLWMKKVRPLGGPDGFDYQHLPPLAGLKMESDEANPFAELCDPAQKELCKRAAQAQPRWSEPRFLAAGVGTFRDVNAIVCDPSAPAHINTVKFRTIMPETGFYTLTSTPMQDLLQGVGSVFMQHYFEPAGTTIRVIDEEPPGNAYCEANRSVFEQVRGLFFVTQGLRQEWIDTEGWQVRVERSGIVSMCKDRQTP